MDVFQSQKPFGIPEELFDLETVIVSVNDFLSGRAAIVRDQIPRFIHTFLLIGHDQAEPEAIGTDENVCRSDIPDGTNPFPENDRFLLFDTDDERMLLSAEICDNRRAGEPAIEDETRTEPEKIREIPYRRDDERIL